MDVFRGKKEHKIGVRNLKSKSCVLIEREKLRRVSIGYIQK